MDRTLMANATSSDDAPTSGFQLSEISRATKSSYQANTQIQQYLVDRLGKPNHNIKFKALIIIKHVCRTGRPEFKREMGRNVDAIRECLQFKGPPDPLRGDEIYRRVRECAREVLEALFDGQMPVTTSAVAAANRIQGLGNDFTPPEAPKASTSAYLSSLASNFSSSIMGEPDAKYAGHPGATSNFGPPGSIGGGGYGNNAGSGYGESSSSGGGYGNNSSGGGGFGNPNFVDARTEKTWLQKASQLASSAASALPGFNTSETKEPLQSNNFNNNGFSQQRSSGTFNRAAFSNPEGGFNRAAFSNPEGAAGGGYNYATNRGPNAIHANSSPYAPQAYPPAAATQSNTWQQQGAPLSSAAGSGMVPDMPLSVPGVGRAGGALSNGVYEKNMIDSLCEPAGLRPVPPEDKLEELLSTASTLSDDIIGNCLMDVLNEEAWQSRTKALIVIAKLVKTPDCSAHLQWWQERVDIVEAMLTDAKANVRTQAHKTLRAIDPNAASGPPPSNAAAPARRVSAARSGGFASTPVPAPVESTAPSTGQYNADNASEMNTTISEDDGTKLSDAMADEVPEAVPEPTQLAPTPPPPVVANLLEMDDLEVPSPAIITTSAPTGVAVAQIPAIPAPPAPVSIPTEVMVTTQPPVSPLGCGKDSSGDLVNTGTDDTDSLFAGMSVGGSEKAAPAPMTAAPVAPPAPAAVMPVVHTQNAAVNIFDFLDSSVSSPPVAAPAPAPPAASNQSELDIFGSMTISNHNTAPPAPVAPVTTGMEAPVQGQQTYVDQFAGLMDPTPAAAGAPAGALTPEQQHQQQQQQQMFQQQQYYAMQAQQGQHPQQGLHLTRPAAPGQGQYHYAYPPRGGFIPGGMPVGVPAGTGAGGRPMMYVGGGQGMPPVPMGVMPSLPQQQPIQLRQGSSIIAPGMLAHTAERKTIPDAPGSSSGFNFMGAGGSTSSRTSAPDSFSFVNDAMKAQK